MLLLGKKRLREDRLAMKVPVPFDSQILFILQNVRFTLNEPSSETKKIHSHSSVFVFQLYCVRSMINDCLDERG